jgi:hypothetical protein
MTGFASAQINKITAPVLSIVLKQLPERRIVIYLMQVNYGGNGAIDSCKADTMTGVLNACVLPRPPGLSGRSPGHQGATISGLIVFAL